MSMFVGSQVEVVLRDHTTLTGTVQEVVAGQNISLRDIYFPATGVRWHQWMVQASAVLDIKIVEATPTETPNYQLGRLASEHEQVVPEAPAPQRQPPTSPTAASTPTIPRQTAQFVDPAILSFAKSPAPIKTFSKPPTAAAPTTPIKSVLAKAKESLPTKASSPFVGAPSQLLQAQGPIRTSAAGLFQSEDAAPAAPSHQDGAQDDQSSKKKARRGVKKGAPKNSSQTTQEQQPKAAVMDSKVSRNGHDMNEKASANANGSVNDRKGKGWRSTPLLQPSPQNSSFGSAKKQKDKARREQHEAYKNGWATEDATDIQDLGDFDFEANHKLFDKKNVFDEIRQGDTTADEDLLVSHNRLPPRPGTHGGKNLHPTENVLSPKLAPKYNSNDLEGTSSEADTELNHPQGRSSSKHSTTRAPVLKKQPSRQNSILPDGRPYPVAASLNSQRATNGSASSLVSKGGKPLPAIATATRQGRRQSPRSAISRTRRARDEPVQNEEPTEPHFTVQGTGTPCPVLHPTALETLETETTSRYALTPDAMTETAARAVAETALSMSEAFPATTSRRASRAGVPGRNSMSTSRTLQTEPVIVILAGNHATGARAVAAIRHLVTRDAKIIVAETSSPTAYRSLDGQPTQLSKQLSMVKKLVRSGKSIKRGNWAKANNYIKNLSGPPAVIIDALLAGEAYENLAPESAAEARSIIDWANRSRAPVLALSCPSGVSGVDGTSTMVEGEPLAVRPERLLGFGAPLLGLLEAVKAGERWEIEVVDVGLNIALNGDETVGFGGGWVVGLEFEEGCSIEQ